MILTPKNWKSFQHYKERTPAWIKLHKGLMTDFEFVRLPVASRALAPMLWLLASEYEGGAIDASIEKIAFRVHMSVDELRDALTPLIDAGFFDASEMLARPLAECLPREEDIGKRTREEGEKNSRSVADATRPVEVSKFEEFWKAYPRRDGPNPRKPAEQKFNALVKTGVDPDVMIAGAKQLAIEESRRGRTGTQFVAQAMTWLNQQRWSDHAASAFKADDGLIEILDQLQLEAWDAYGRQHNGKGYPRNKKGGWRFPSKWPPGYEQDLVSGVMALVNSGNH